MLQRFAFATEASRRMPPIPCSKCVTSNAVDEEDIELIISHSDSFRELEGYGVKTIILISIRRSVGSFLCALLHLGPGVAQADSPVEDQFFRR
jgi:hypothetical protein